MDAQMMSYGAQNRVLDNWMNSIDDRMIQIEMNQERLISDFCVAYSIPLSGYLISYNEDGTPRED